MHLRKALRLEKTNTFGVNVSLGAKPVVENYWVAIGNAGFMPHSAQLPSYK